MPRVFNRKSVKDRRRELRNNMPDAEVLLWQQLKGRQLLGYKFRRQYSVGEYIVDFFCPELRLGIELDGDSHFEEGAKEYDAGRDRFIQSFGITMNRYLNTDVYENMDGVLEHLLDVVRALEQKREII